jgi:hypothetical protein
MTPDTFAEEVASIYEDVIAALNEITNEMPDYSAALHHQVSKLKAIVIEQLIQYGHLRQNMSEDSKIRSKLFLSCRISQIQDSPVWKKTRNVIYRFYVLKDTSFGELIQSFESITEYAVFEDLMKRSPDEALKHGVFKKE